MKKILIVDDLKSILMTLEAILTKEGFYVAACTNSMDAFDKLNNEHFDLVITDAIMPGTSGYSLITTVRSSEQRNKDVPIIMLTGKREKADIEKALSAGANDYIIKPIDPDMIIAKVKALLDNTKRSDFAEASINAPATINVKTDILSISEIQMKLVANYQLNIGQLYRVSSEFLQQLELETLSIRISECNKSSDNPSNWYITGQFVGLGDKELSKIRLWVRKKLSGI